MHRQLSAYMSDNHLLSSSQHGFRPLHSTETALLSVTNRAFTSMDHALISLLFLLDFNPRPGRAFSITRPGRGASMRPPPLGVSKLSVVALRKKKKQSIALDENSRLVVYLFTLGQHLTQL